MALTEEKLKAAAKKAYAAGDMKSAQELFEQARRITGPAFEASGRMGSAVPSLAAQPSPSFEASGRMGASMAPRPAPQPGPAFEDRGRMRSAAPGAEPVLHRAAGFDPPEKAKPVTDAEWFSMSRAQREARGLPVSEIGWRMWGEPPSKLEAHKEVRRDAATQRESDRLAAAYEASLDQKTAAPAYASPAPTTPPRGTGRVGGQNANDMTVAERIAAAKAGTLTQPSEGKLATTAAFDNVAEMQMNQKEVGPTGAFLGSIAPGLTFGFADEMAAGAAALGGQPYGETLEGLRAQQDKLREDNPKASLAGEVAGGMAGAMTGMGIAARGAATLPGKAAAGALAGGAEGALYGFGSGEGGFQSRAMEAGKTAAIGGLVGGAAPAVIAGAKMAGSAIANPIASALNIPSDVRAGAAIEKMMGRAGMTADDANNAIARAGAEGQPEFLLADALGNSGQRGLSGIARQPGDARQIIAEALMKRQDGQGNRISSFLADALDAPDTAAARKGTMTAARGAAADTAYGAARTGAAPVDVTGALGVIDDRLGPMAGSGIADDGIGGKLAKYRGRLAAADPAATTVGGPTASAVEMSDFDRVLGLKQEIGDDIGAAVRAGRNNEARELMKVQKALDEALEAASPDYRLANDSFAKASREIDMVDEGAAATSGRVRSDDTAAKIARMTPEERKAFAAGYADPLIAKVDSSAPGVNKARPLRNEKTQAELGLMANDPALLGRRIDRENTMFETNVAALGGSKTADNLADIADTTAMSASVIGNVVSGRWGAAAGQLADKLMAGATGTNPATREIIAKALMSRDPAAALAPIAKRRGVTEPMERIIAALARSTAIRQ